MKRVGTSSLVSGPPATPAGSFVSLGCGSEAGKPEPDTDWIGARGVATPEAAPRIAVAHRLLSLSLSAAQPAKYCEFELASNVYASQLIPSVPANCAVMDCPRSSNINRETMTSYPCETTSVLAERAMRPLGGFAFMQSSFDFQYSNSPGYTAPQRSFQFLTISLLL